LAIYKFIYLFISLNYSTKRSRLNW